MNGPYGPELNKLLQHHVHNVQNARNTGLDDSVSHRIEENYWTNEWLCYHTSPIDWTEPNYESHEYIAEWKNTLSCAAFLIVTYFGISELNKRKRIYIRITEMTRTKISYSDNDLRIAYYLCGFIGVTSAYFHATLSLLGQILDEVSILLLVQHCIFSILKVRFSIRLLFHLVFSCLLFVYPSYNAYILFISGLITFKILMARPEFTDSENRMSDHIKNLYFYFFLGLVVWLIDKIGISYISFGQTKVLHIHFIWHAIAACLANAGITFVDEFNRTLKI